MIIIQAKPFCGSITEIFAKISLTPMRALREAKHHSNTKTGYLNHLKLTRKICLPEMAYKILLAS